MAVITNITTECTSITELRICLKSLIRKMYQSYRIGRPDFIDEYLDSRREYPQ